MQHTAGPRWCPIFIVLHPDEHDDPDDDHFVAEDDDDEHGDDDGDDGGANDDDDADYEDEYKQMTSCQFHFCLLIMVPLKRPGLGN